MAMIFLRQLLFPGPGCRVHTIKPALLRRIFNAFYPMLTKKQVSWIKSVLFPIVSIRERGSARDWHVACWCIMEIVT
jgi:hypothetical protein